MQKTQFPALLLPGFRRFELSELHDVFVAPFTDSVRRSILLAGLTKFIGEIKALDITGELWFDGSFVTEKLDPDDIDLVVVFDRTSVATLTLEQQQKVQHLFNQPSSKAKYNCDVYCVQNDDVVMVSYWRGWFGFKRDGQTAKGIGSITL